MEYEGDSDTNCGWCIWENPQRIGKGTGKLGNKRTSIQTIELLTIARILKRVLET